jgi:hypothetical protein
MDVCILEQSKLGHDKESAGKICGTIKDRAEKGVLYKAEDAGLHVLSKAGDEDLVLGGNASWEIPDDQRDVFTVEAQVKALERFFAQPPEYQSITVNHTEFKLAQPMLKYVDSKGQEFFSHVHEKGTYLVSKLRNDDLKTTRFYREEAQKGNLNGYSVSAVPLGDPALVKASDGYTAHRWDDMEYWSITIAQKGVKKPVNPMTRNVEVISKAAESPAKSGDDALALKTRLEKASREDIETELLEKYRERSMLEKLLYPPMKNEVAKEVFVSSESPEAPDPALEAAKEAARQRLSIIRIEIWALEEALKQKILVEYKAVKPVETAPDFETETILVKHGFTGLASKK